MYGKLEDGETKVTSEQAQEYIDKIFDISPVTADVILAGMILISEEDFEFCIAMAKAARIVAKKVIGGEDEHI